METRLPREEVSLLTSRRERGDARELRPGELAQPLRERLGRGQGRAAFDYLARETSLDALNACIERIADQEITEFCLEQMFLTGSLLSCEAFTGIESIRSELKGLSERAPREEPATARVLYDRKVEKLGQHFFALGRRLHQLEQYMASCPLSGSGEQIRGRYGQRVRDLAGDIRFMRQELSRWVRRFVPLRVGASQAAEDRQLLEGRIDAVVDELGLRIREVRETLHATLFEQLVVIDSSLTRKTFFRREMENVLDVGRLLAWLSNLFDRVKEFDEGRRADQLQRVKTLVADVRPEQFLSFACLRESDQGLFRKSIEDLKRYSPRPSRGGEDDPIKVFLLLTGDLIATLRRQHRDPE